MTGDCPSNNPLAHHHDQDNDQDDDQDDGDKYFDNFNAPMGECMIQRNKNICEVLTLAFTLFSSQLGFLQSLIPVAFAFTHLFSSCATTGTSAPAPPRNILKIY